MLYRLFPSIPGSDPLEPGGPLHVPRPYQGRGRHDNPPRYGALYASRVPVAPIAEALRDLAMREIGERHLERGQGRLALVALEDTALPPLIDLDDPGHLVARRLRPSRVATSDRDTTQSLAMDIYSEGVPGFEWWSTIEGSWINVTLFADRVLDLLRPAAEPEILTLEHPLVEAAALVVGVKLAAR